MQSKPYMNIELLNENYDEIFSGSFGVGPKRFVGPSKPIQCRFCGRSTLEVSFRNEAHAIPELLGNRQLIVTDECDSCNELFCQSLEDHLGKFTTPYRVIGQTKGKTGVPSYKTPKGLSRIDLKPGKSLEIAEHQDDPIIEWKKERNQMGIPFTRQRHIPCAVYKALVKIALSVMPEKNLKEFALTKRWILDRDHTKPLLQPLKLLLTFVPGPRPYEYVSIMVLQKRATSTAMELPHCLLVLAFGNLQLQIMVPALSDNRARADVATVQFRIPWVPTPFDENWQYGAPQQAVIDLSSAEVSEPGQEVTTLMHYDRITEIVS
jgi:hypothetical protein